MSDHPPAAAAKAPAAATKQTLTGKAWSATGTVIGGGIAIVVLFMVLGALLPMIFQSIGGLFSMLVSFVGNIGSFFSGLAGATGTLLAGFFQLAIKILFIALGVALAIMAAKEMAKWIKGGDGHH
jgi:hypothetical protein